MAMIEMMCWVAQSVRRKTGLGVGIGDGGVDWIGVLSACGRLGLSPLVSVHLGVFFSSW